MRTVNAEFRKNGGVGAAYFTATGIDAEVKAGEWLVEQAGGPGSWLAPIEWRTATVVPYRSARGTGRIVIERLPGEARD